MSESVAPSTSRVAMSIAFKRARRMFPKNFGLKSNSEEAYQSSEHENSPPEPNQVQEPTNFEILETTVSDPLESSLVDSLEGVEISDKADILCDDCNHYPDDFESNDAEVTTALPMEEKIEGDCDRQQIVDYSDEFENTLDSGSKSHQQNYGFRESSHSYSLTWKEESDHCDNLDSDVEPPRIFEIPQKYDRPGETTPSRRKKSHRCKKSSTRSSARHSCTSNFAYDDDRSLHSPDCPYYSHCATSHCCHNQHCHRYCCCRSHCCCGRYCLNCQDHIVNSTRAQEPSISTCRRSSYRKKRERYYCSTCNRRCSSPSKSASIRRMTDTCSRDSGIFTSVRYENEDYDENDDAVSNTLEHKDSLCLLQEKFNSGSRNHHKKCERLRKEDKRRERVDGPTEDEDLGDEEAKRNPKSHKFSRRLLSRCSNSY